MKCIIHNFNYLCIIIAVITLPFAYLFPFDCFFADNACPSEHIKFWLYKNSTKNEPLLLDPLNLTAEAFRPRWPLKILIHGFHGNQYVSPNVELRPLLLNHRQVHVISVDYSRLAHFPCYYPWSVQNVRVVARCLGQLIDSLIERDIYTADDIHLIGFSLGAQVAGLTANYVKQPLQRITGVNFQLPLGLDPAGPGFATQNRSERLDASDAAFVDVMHTDPFFYSSLERGGHADFYPNLNLFSQPGCNIVEDGRLRNCNHFRAPLYYAESIVSEHGFWSYYCGESAEFLKQQCQLFSDRPHEAMGYFVSNNASGVYFLETRPSAPFAKGPLVGLELQTSRYSTGNPN